MNKLIILMMCVATYTLATIDIHKGAVATGLPEGSYKNSCTLSSCTYDTNTKKLKCKECTFIKKETYYSNESELQLPCPDKSDIVNDSGTLKCSSH